MIRGVLDSLPLFFDNTKHRHVANLIEMELPSSDSSVTKLYLTDYSKTVTYKGNQYTPGKIKSLTEFRQTKQLTSAQITISMTGLDETILQLYLLEGHSIQGKKVTVHQAYINPTNNSVTPIMVNDEPFIWFRGKLSGAQITDRRDTPLGETVISWTCSNDFYDFERVLGRYTSDEAHRALVVDEEGNKVPSGAAKRPEYNDDLGFFHLDKSINILAQYQVEEERYKISTNSKGLFGIRGVEVEVDTYYETVTKEADLQFDLSAKYLPAVYGTQFVGGIPIFADTDHDNPNMVWVVYLICEGEIEGILDIHVGGKPIICLDDTDDEGRVCFGRKRVVGDTMNIIAANLNGDPETLPSGPSVHGQSYVLDDDNGIITFWTYHGLRDQTAAEVLVEKALNNGFWYQNDQGLGPEYWDENFKLLDTLYVIAKIEITENRNNIPDFMFEVKGRKIRTYNSELVPEISQSSSNPLWQVLDYLTSIFGLNIPLDLIDLPSFYDVASLFDIIDTSYDVSWVPFWRYLNWNDALTELNKAVMQTNWVVDTSSSVFDCLKSLLEQSVSSFNMFHGKYYLTAERDLAPVLHIELNNTIGGNVRIIDSTGREKFNSVSASILDPLSMWAGTQINFYNSEFLQQDSMQQKQMNLVFNGITNYYTARSMLSRELKKSRYARTLDDIKPDNSLFYLLPNDPVTLSYDRYSFDHKKFFVNEIGISPQGKISLVLKEFLDDVFIDSPQSDNSGNQIPSIDTNILPPTDLTYTPEVTLLDDLIGINGYLRWKASLSTGILYYTVYQSGKIDPYTVEVTLTNQQDFELVLIGLEEGNYTFEVRLVTLGGKRSKPAVLTTMINPAKSLSAITGFQVVNRVPGEGSNYLGGYIKLIWDRSPDEDLVSPLYYVLEFATSNDILLRSLRLQNLYTYTYLLLDMKLDYATTNLGLLGVYRNYKIRIRAEGDNGELSVYWTEIL